MGDYNNDDTLLPNDVCRWEQLQNLPVVCLNKEDRTTTTTLRTDTILQNDDHETGMNDQFDNENTIDIHRPLQHYHENGLKTTYSLTPMKYSIIFILLVEIIERFAFYSINYTQTSYLTGQYDHHRHPYHPTHTMGTNTDMDLDEKNLTTITTMNSSTSSSSTTSETGSWNAHFNSIQASTYVSLSIAVAYTAPFLGSYLCHNCKLGEYNTILVGCIGWYWPGLFCIFLTTIPSTWWTTMNRCWWWWMGYFSHNDDNNNTDSDNDYHTTNTNEFNSTLLSIGFLFLWPIGSGIVKSVVNIFGAKQFHPLLQSSFIEIYYVHFYMCINIGALLGGILVPLVAQHSILIAYLIPVIMLLVGIGVFIAGSSRYVKEVPDLITFCPTGILKKMKQCFCHSNNQRNDENNNNNQNPIHNNNNKSTTNTKPVPGTLLLYQPPNFVTSPSRLHTITNFKLFCVFLLIVPFCVTYSQMPTTFIVQGTIMKKGFGFIDAALMYNGDTIAVLLFGYLIGSVLYPYLISKRIKLATTTKFALGSFFGSMALLWAWYVDCLIRSVYRETGQSISILYQSLSYFFIGIGEIFAISSAYEIAFTASPPDQKIISSALNIFCIGGIPNVLCIVLYHLCTPWFTNKVNGTTQISTIAEYTTSRTDKYFLLLFGIAVSGVIINLLPPVRRFVESIENQAADIIKTPKMLNTPKMKRRLLQNQNSSGTLSGTTTSGSTSFYDNNNNPNKNNKEQTPLLVRNSHVLMGTTSTGVPTSTEQCRHEYYLKYGSNRNLYHAGSFRAGPTLHPPTDSSQQQQMRTSSNNNNKKGKNEQMKKTTITKLYQTEDVSIDINNNSNNRRSSTSSTSLQSIAAASRGNQPKNEYIYVQGGRKIVTDWKPKTREK